MKARGYFQLIFLIFLVNKLQMIQENILYLMPFNWPAKFRNFNVSQNRNISSFVSIKVFINNKLSITNEPKWN